MESIVARGFIVKFLADYGPMLDLVPTDAGQDGKSLAPCWHEHPVSVMELSGIYLAWTGLISAMGPDAAVVPSSREWLDLANATVPARERAIAATRACHRSGKHIETVERQDRSGVGGPSMDAVLGAGASR